MSEAQLSRLQRYHEMSTYVLNDWYINPFTFVSVGASDLGTGALDSNVGNMADWIPQATSALMAIHTERRPAQNVCLMSLRHLGVQQSERDAKLFRKRRIGTLSI